VARLKLLALVEMRASAVGSNANRWFASCETARSLEKRMSPEWPTLRLAVGVQERKGEIDAPGPTTMPQGSPCTEKACHFQMSKSVMRRLQCAPAPPGHRSLSAIEYHDVHAIDQPELRKTFKSFSKMKAWFKVHASKNEGSGADDKSRSAEDVLEESVCPYRYCPISADIGRFEHRSATA